MSKYLLLFALLSALLFASCEKSDVINQNLGFSSVKIYPDSLASAEVSSVRISSGKNSLYMTYGYGAGNPPFINSVFLQGSKSVTSVLMSTDLQGNLKWKKVLKEGVSACSAVELEDESCIIAESDLFSTNTNVSDQQIYLFRFAANGAQLLADSITLPAPFAANYGIFSLDILHLQGNDILIYGTAFDLDNSASKGFALKYNPNAGIDWVKEVNFGENTELADINILHNCIKSKDGNLLFSGIFTGPNQLGVPEKGKTFIIKTSAMGDVIWKKWFDYLNAVPPNEIEPGNLIELSDGRIYLCNNDVPNFDIPYKYKGYIYELNATGDSIGGYNFLTDGNSYCAAIIEGENQQVIAVINPFPGFLNNEFKPVYTPFQTEIYTFSNNLKNSNFTKMQTRRSDFMTAACKTTQGKIAFFGLSRTANHQAYVPCLNILK